MSAPWRADGASCLPRMSRLIEFAVPGVGDRRWEKNSASNRPHPGADATRHRRGPDGWPEMDASYDRADRSAIAGAWYPGERSNRGSATEADGFLPAGESQKAIQRLAGAARRAVHAHRR